LIINCGEGITLLQASGNHNQGRHSHDSTHKNHNYSHSHSNFDPHIWLSINNAIKMSENIRDALISFDSENKDFYFLNASQLIIKLNELKEQTHEKLENIKTRKFMIFHPAFGYYANDFNLTQISIEVGGKAPGPKQLKNIIDTANEQNIKVIFASPSFSTKSAEIVAKEIGGSVVLIDPLAGDYINNLIKISKTFQEILE
jgi:zinc transport system substrate-binding protein